MDTRSPIITQLPRDQRVAVANVTSLMERIDCAPAGQRRTVIEEIAAEHSHRKGYSEKSLYRKYKAWVDAGREKMALINGATRSRLTRRNSLYHCYKLYCENNQRGSRAAWRQMVYDLAEGKSLPHGVGDWREVFRRERGLEEALPNRCPYSLSSPPRGWTYSHLQAVAGLDEFEKSSARVGLSKARQFYLPVLTTRVGLHLGQYLQFDDKWHDVEVNFDGQKRSVRPVEFVCRDVLSAMTWARGIRPRVFNEEKRKHESLKESEMRFMAAHILTTMGVYRGGSVWVVEHGTAAYSDADIERVNRLHPGLIRAERSGILADQVHEGMWAGKQGGNFRLKGLLESLHGLDHNELAALPGQIGRNRDNSPEQFKHLSAYNIELLKAAARLDPERRAMLQFPLLPFTQYNSIVHELYDRMDDRQWHTLEGWEACGFETAEYRLGEDSNWFPVSSLLDMSSDKREAITAFISTRPECKRIRRLSPREVYQRNKADLVKIPLFEIPDILRRSDGFSTTVEHNGTIQFNNQYIGPGTHIFHANVETPAGYRQALTPGAEYWVHISPYQPDLLFISDFQSGAILGMAPRYDRAPRYDLAAVHKLQGAQAAHRAALSRDVRGRHSDEAVARHAMIAHNDAVISGAPVTDGERSAVRSADGVDLNEEMLIEQRLIAARMEENDADTTEGFS